METLAFRGRLDRLAHMAQSGITVFFSAQGSQRVVVDIVCIAWWFIGALMFALAQTYADVLPDLAFKATIGLAYMVTGILFVVFIIGIQWDRLLDLDDFLNNGVAPTLMGLFGAVVWNLIVARTFSSGATVSSQAPFGAATFAVLMGGVGESTLFNGALQTTIRDLFGSDILGAVAESTLAALFHTVIYAGDLTTLIAVLGGFMAFSLAFIWSGYRLAVPITAHGGYNLLVFLR